MTTDRGRSAPPTAPPAPGTPASPVEVLFVARRFPPSVGGMQTAAYELLQALRARDDVRVTAVTWGRSRRVLLPVAGVKLVVLSLLHIARRRPDVVFVQDAALAGLGVALSRLAHRPLVVAAHGLDVTFPPRSYQSLLRASLRRAARVVAVSRSTAEVIRLRHPTATIDVVPNGVTDRFCTGRPQAELRREVARATGLDPQALLEHRILLSHGRLMPRKGLDWFVDRVAPTLLDGDSQPPAIHLISGAGPAATDVARAVARHGLTGRVLLLGRVPDALVPALYGAADLVVMPNVPTEGDVEGFGLVAVEASSSGTPVICSDLEGLRDAVVDGVTGRLVPPGDARAFREAIAAELRAPALRRSEVRAFTLSHWSWQTTAEGYARVFAAASRDSRAAGVRGRTPGTPPG